MTFPHPFPPPLNWLPQQKDVMDTLPLTLREELACAVNNRLFSQVPKSPPGPLLWKLHLFRSLFINLVLWKLLPFSLLSLKSNYCLALEPSRMPEFLTLVQQHWGNVGKQKSRVCWMQNTVLHSKYCFARKLLFWIDLYGLPFSKSDLITPYIRNTQ